MNTTRRPYLYLVACALAMAPFFGGLYLWDSQLGFLLCLTSVTFVFLIHDAKRREKHVLSRLDYAVIALSALYLISAIWSVAPRQAVQVGLKQILYLEIYWLISRSLVTAQDRTVGVRILAVIPVLVAVATVLLAAGWIPYVGGALVGNRLAGPFQYPNTLAAFLLFGVGLLVAYRGQATSLSSRVLTGGGLFWSLSVFVFTYSRTAWLVAPLVVVLSVALVSKGNRMSAMMGVLASLLSTGLIFVPVDQALRKEVLKSLPFWFVGGWGVSLGVEYLNYLIRDREKIQWWAVGFVGAAAIGAVGLSLTKAASLLQRLASFSSVDESLFGRYLSSRDALHAWLTVSPLLGLGGNGWFSVYRAFRSGNYVIRIIHSGLVEALVDLGVLGASLLLAVWVLSLLGAWRGRRGAETPSESTLWAGVFAGLVGLLMHVLFDFDMWYGSFSMLLFAVLGYCRSSSPVRLDGSKDHTASGWGIWTVSAGALLVATVAGVFLHATSQHATAVQLVAEGQYETAESAFRTSVRLVPIDAAYRASLGDFLVQYGQVSGKASLFQEGGRDLSTALRLDRFNPDYHLLYADYLQRDGRGTEALDEYLHTISIDPYSIFTYQDALEQGIDLSVQTLATQASNGKSTVNQVGAIFSEMDRARQSQPSGLPEDWLLNVDDPLILVYRGAYMALTGHYSEAAQLIEPLTQSKDPEVAKKAVFWATAIYRVSGRLPEAQRSELQLKLLDDSLSSRVSEIVQALAVQSNIK